MRGIFAAVDLTTNKLAWRQQWGEMCYSGSIVTKGGLVFVGRNDSRFTALDKDNGKLLWDFPTDAAVNATASTFEHNGKQYVVVHAGGSFFPGTKHGDSLWMFSLKGTMKSLPVGGAQTVRRRWSRRCIRCAGCGTSGEPPCQRGPRPPAVRRSVRRVSW